MSHAILLIGTFLLWKQKKININLIKIKILTGITSHEK